MKLIHATAVVGTNDSVMPEIDTERYTRVSRRGVFSRARLQRENKPVTAAATQE